MLRPEHRLPSIAFVMVAALCGLFVVQGRVTSPVPGPLASGPDAPVVLAVPGPLWVAPGATPLERRPRPAVPAPPVDDPGHADVRAPATVRAVASPAETSPALATPTMPASTQPQRQRVARAVPVASRNDGGAAPAGGPARDGSVGSDGGRTHGTGGRPGDHRDGDHGRGHGRDGDHGRGHGRHGGRGHDRHGDHGRGHHGHRGSHHRHG